MILTDFDIRELCAAGRADPLISPFLEDKLVGPVSSGLTHSGYDLRMAREVRIFKPSYGVVVDPALFKSEEYCRKVFDDFHVEGDSFVLPGAPSYALVRTVEKFNVPSYLKGHCLGKSTYARCGIIVNTTPLEPGWRGHLVIEIANTNPCPVKLYVDMGIAQVEFHQLLRIPEKLYGAKKYQDQEGVVPARSS